MGSFSQSAVSSFSKLPVFVQIVIRVLIILSLIAITLIGGVQLLATFDVHPVLVRFLSMAFLPGTIAAVAATNLRFNQRLIILFIPTLIAGMLVWFLGERFIDSVTEQIAIQQFKPETQTLGVMLSDLGLWVNLLVTYALLRGFFSSTLSDGCSTIGAKVATGWNLQRIVGILVFFSPFFMAFTFFPSTWMGVFVLFYASIGAALFFLPAIGLSVPVRSLLWGVTVSTALLAVYYFLVINPIQPSPVTDIHNDIKSFTLMGSLLFGGILGTIATLWQYLVQKQEALHAIRTFGSTLDIDVEAILSSMKDRLERIDPRCWLKEFQAVIDTKEYLLRDGNNDQPEGSVEAT